MPKWKPILPPHLLASSDLHARPELAALSVLAAALDAVDAALWHQHPEHDWDPERPGPHHSIGLECHIANTILVLTTELKMELERYWSASGHDQLRLPDLPF